MEALLEQPLSNVVSSSREENGKTTCCGRRQYEDASVQAVGRTRCAPGDRPERPGQQVGDRRVRLCWCWCWRDGWADHGELENACGGDGHRDVVAASDVRLQAPNDLIGPAVQRDRGVVAGGATAAGTGHRSGWLVPARQQGGVARMAHVGRRDERDDAWDFHRNAVWTSRLSGVPG